MKVNTLTIKELCEKHSINQTELSKRFEIPLRTVQDWHGGRRKAPDYVVKMIDTLLSQKR